MLAILGRAILEEETITLIGIFKEPILNKPFHLCMSEERNVSTACSTFIYPAYIELCMLLEVVQKIRVQISVYTSLNPASTIQ
jgi:hypothetical protein